MSIKHSILLFLAASAAAACAAQSGVGYPSVSAALESLKAKPDNTVNVTKPDGWVIVTEAGPAFAVWSFPPAGHYAYPAVVRRVIAQQPSGAVDVETAVLCQAEKEPCDRLVQEFQQLNEQMREQVRARLQGKGM